MPVWPNCGCAVPRVRRVVLRVVLVASQPRGGDGAAAKGGPVKTSDLPLPLRAKLPPRQASHYPKLVGEPVRIVVPIPTVSEANAHTHWRVRQKRAKSQRLAVTCHLLFRRCDLPALPCIVTMTRLSPRKLDDDNAVGAMKHVRDAIAAYYRVDDGDPRWTWRVAQEKSKAVGVRIEIGGAS